MLDWIDLTETVTRRRATGTTQTPRGKLLPSAVTTQPIRCLIQPHRGTLQYEVEGTLQAVTEAMYCNPVTAKAGGVPTDIQELDTIIRANGSHRRVAFVADEGGQGDHFKVYLVAVNSGAAGTGSGD